MMLPRNSYRLPVLLLLAVIAAPLAAQAPSFEKARETYREALKRPKVDERVAGIRELVEAKDVRAVDEMLGAVRTQDRTVEKKREQIEQIGLENRKIWKQYDQHIERQKEQGVTDPKIPVELHNRTVLKANELQEKLAEVNRELVVAEATRAALMAGIGKLLTTVDPAARTPAVLDLASAAGKVRSYEDKVVFIRLFGAIRTPESRDALIEIARLDGDGKTRTAAVAALGALEDPTAIPTLGEALKDEVWSVKTAAAQAIAVIPSIEGVPPLAAALAENEGGTADAIVKALEDIAGITFFDNATLWADWFKTQGGDVKAALDDLDSGEPSVRKAAMSSLAAKGTIAGARKMLAQEGLDPLRDSRSKFRRSTLAAPESRPADKDEIEERRDAIGRILSTRPKMIRDRAVASLVLEPLTHSRELGDHETLAAYMRTTSRVKDAQLVAMLAATAERLPKGEDAEEQEQVKRAAIEALGWQDNDDAVVSLFKVLREDKTSKEAKQVAIGSLVRLRREECVPPLIDLLLEKGELAKSAAAALKTLTGADHGTDRQAWHTWWNDKGKATAQLGKRKTEEEKKKEEEEGKAGEAGRGTTFYGITTRSKRLIYVLDISGSMNEHDAVGRTGGKSEETRIDRAKRELKASITSLPEDALFNIIVYADGLALWKSKLTTADKNAKAEAHKWVDEKRAIGATNIFDALEKAFELAGRGATDKRYNLAVDTILFMSDGQPNRGRIVNPRAIVAEIARLNEHKKVTIHTIGVGEGHDVELMKRLARLNGGTYVAR